MKNILTRTVKILLYPLIWCFRTVRDAPVISCDNALIGFGEYSRSPDPGYAASRPCKSRQHLC